MHSQHQLLDQFKICNTVFSAEPYPSRLSRTNALKSLMNLLKTDAFSLADALNRDFSTRAHEESCLLEIYPTIKAIKYCLKHLKSWMKNRKRHVEWILRPTQAWLFPQPLGVVGIMSPWNYPLYLSLVPAAYAIAAGNRIMIKMSELSCDTAQTLALLIKKHGLNEWITVISGELEISKEFAALPFHHLLFTGSSRVGKQVMQSASHNLTPLTLELSGKSPLVVSKTVNPNYFHRILMGKLYNAGQTCIAPDYLFLPVGHSSSFEIFCRQFIEQHYNNLKNNPYFTSIISTQHTQRLLSLIEEAKQAGAHIVKIGDDHPEEKRLAFYLIFSPDNTLRVMHEEIFGPILPILLYDDFKMVMDEIKSRPNPLAIYYFGCDTSEMNQLQYQTRSGALSINETLMHAAMDDLPFGGVGESGFGSYHGHEGFQRFSNFKPMIKRGRYSLAPWLYPPYGRCAAWFFKWFAGLRI